MVRLFGPLLILSLTLAGCGRDDIQTYKIPKESGPDAGLGKFPATFSKEIEWRVPAGWKEQAPSSMRVGSFLIGAVGRQADVSVIPLSGQAGGDLSNINRWRGQINLGSISETDLPKESQPISPSGRPMLFVDFANQNKRLMGAIYHRGEQTWFFKMTGDRNAVAAEKAAFLQFLKYLKFHDQ